MFLGVVLFPCLIKSFSSKSNCGKLVLGLLLSYCSRFCNLIALLWAPKTNSMEALRGLSIWDKITSPEIMWGFIIVLFFISSVRVYQGKAGDIIIKKTSERLPKELGIALVHSVVLNKVSFTYRYTTH